MNHGANVWGCLGVGVGIGFSSTYSIFRFLLVGYVFFHLGDDGGKQFCEVFGCDAYVFACLVAVEVEIEPLADVLFVFPGDAVYEAYPGGFV